MPKKEWKESGPKPSQRKKKSNREPSHFTILLIKKGKVMSREEVLRGGW